MSIFGILGTTELFLSKDKSASEDGDDSGEQDWRSKAMRILRVIGWICLILAIILLIIMIFFHFYEGGKVHTTGGSSGLSKGFRDIFSPTFGLILALISTLGIFVACIIIRLPPCPRRE